MGVEAELRTMSRRVKVWTGEMAWTNATGIERKKPSSQFVLGVCADEYHGFLATKIPGPSQYTNLEAWEEIKN